MALDHLREYCNSPECNAWRVISRLKHPTRYDALRQQILECIIYFLLLLLFFFLFVLFCFVFLLNGVCVFIFCFGS